MTVSHAYELLRQSHVKLRDTTNVRIGVRVGHVLQELNIETEDQLFDLSRSDVLALKGIGPVTWNHIRYLQEDIKRHRREHPPASPERPFYATCEKIGGWKASSGFYSSADEAYDELMSQPFTERDTIEVWKLNFEEKDQ